MKDLFAHIFAPKSGARPIRHPYAKIPHSAITHDKIASSSAKMLIKAFGLERQSTDKDLRKGFLQCVAMIKRNERRNRKN